ncbi:MAG: flagellar cap protein FliD N-terminal domain-containing protein, partial [Clostridia bacterium]|nr:flagellar cap protein FliD N-terminal domain-containing protein [Clostridia bacterium]
MSASVDSTSSTSSSSTGDLSSATGVDRYYGLASGLDVDTIVNGLLTNDQSKLDKEGQLQQTLEWKQSAYQSITTELRTFQSSYLDILGSGSMLSSNTYSSYTGTSSSSVLSVSGNSAATAGKHTVDIYQSAVTSSVTGTAVSP